MLPQIPDELVFESPDHEVEKVSQLIRHHMQGVYTLRVPLKVNLGVGHSWAEAH